MVHSLHTPITPIWDLLKASIRYILDIREIIYSKHTVPNEGVLVSHILKTIIVIISSPPTIYNSQ